MKRRLAADGLARRVLGPRPSRLPAWLRLVAVPAVAGAVVLAFWLGGGKLTNNFAASLVLTAVLVGAVGLASLVAALRYRQFAIPVLATFVLSSGAIGGYLAWSSLRDKVVDERVIVAAPAATDAAGIPVDLASGSFESGAHKTGGRAAIVELPDGRRFLTLTEFETDPGPDLRVYVAPGADGDVTDATDVGELKGNIGDQQYELPAGLDVTALGSIVIWCRAFSVSFGAATLRSTLGRQRSSSAMSPTATPSRSNAPWLTSTAAT